MLRELTRNLLHNAIRATPRGAALSLHVEDDGREVRLVVSDSGPGIPAAQREHLFEAFHTGHPTTGSGLGLTICREVCERMGGRIALIDRAAPGGGVAGLDAVACFPRWAAGGAAPQSSP
jgi:two-component system sensor histidine kinase TctE